MACTGRPEWKTGGINPKDLIALLGTLSGTSATRLYENARPTDGRQSVGRSRAGVATKLTFAFEVSTFAERSIMNVGEIELSSLSGPADLVAESASFFSNFITLSPNLSNRRKLPDHWLACG